MTATPPVEEFQVSSEGQMTSEGMSARDLLSSIWQTRYFVFTSVLLAALALAGLIMFLRASIPSVQTFQHAIHFTFPGVTRGQYPNSLKFSLKDLVSPIVLQEVYKNNELEKQGIELAKFLSSVSVAPYSTTYNEAVQRFQSRLGNRKLTFVERTEIEKEMQNSLSHLSSSNALIRFHVRSRLGISAMMGEKIVQDIAKSWSDISISKRGVLKLPAAIETKALIDPNFTRSLDYPAILDVFNKSLIRITSSINSLVKVGGAKTISDKTSGHTAQSLRRDVQNFHSYKMPSLNSISIRRGLVRHPEESKDFLKQRIALLTLRKLRLEAQATAVSVAISTYSAPEGSSQAVGAASRAPGQTAMGSSAQISADFIDRITSLVKKGVGEEFRKELVEKQLRLKTEATSVDLEIQTIQQVLDGLTGKTSGLSEKGLLTTPAGIEKAFKEVDTEFLAATDKLNNYWTILGRLHDEISEKKFSYGSRLYRDLLVKDRIATYHPMFTKQVLFLYLAALFVVAILAMFLGLLLSKRRRAAS